MHAKRGHPRAALVSSLAAAPAVRSSSSMPFPSAGASVTAWSPPASRCSYPTSVASGSAVVTGRTAFVAAMDVISLRFRFASRSRHELDVGNLGHVADLLDADAHSPRTRLLFGRTGIGGRHRHGDER